MVRIVSSVGLLIMAIGWLTACQSKDPKFQQYYVQGEQLYVRHCSNCHQKNGEGLGLIYPPLNQSDYLEENWEQVICQIKNGKSGEMAVNGKSFNQPMPGNPLLTDLEIAEIMTYIGNTWSHQKGLIDVQRTTIILDQCR